jgi:hypothetical protein
MKSSRVLVVAALAVASLAALAQASVTSVVNTDGSTTYTITASTYGQIDAWGTYADGATDATLGGNGWLLNLTYDITTDLPALTSGSYTAAIVYERGYSSDQAIASVCQLSKLVATSGLIGWNNYEKYIPGTSVPTPAMGNYTVATATGLQVATDGNYGGFQSVDVTSIVQAWVSDSSSNLGVNMTTHKADLSAEFSEGLLGYIPTLQITTTIPEPMTMGLLAVGGIAALLRRRRMA